MKACPDCNGDGVIEKGTDDEQRCPTCGGLGFVADDNGDNEEEAINAKKTFVRSRCFFRGCFCANSHGAKTR